jgi:hypothetical protein
MRVVLPLRQSTGLVDLGFLLWGAAMAAGGAWRVRRRRGRHALLPGACDAGRMATAKAATAAPPARESVPQPRQTAENTCRHCAGRGVDHDDRRCPHCGGSGRMLEMVGDA